MLMVRIAVHDARATKRQTAKLPSPRCRRSDTPPAANKTNLDTPDRWLTRLVRSREWTGKLLVVLSWVPPLAPWSFRPFCRPSGLTLLGPGQHPPRLRRPPALGSRRSLRPTARHLVPYTEKPTLPHCSSFFQWATGTALRKVYLTLEVLPRFVAPSFSDNVSKLIWIQERPSTRKAEVIGCLLRVTATESCHRRVTHLVPVVVPFLQGLPLRSLAGVP